VFEKLSETERKNQIKKVGLMSLRGGQADRLQTNGIFQLNVKNAEGKEAIWVWVIWEVCQTIADWSSIDMKNEGKVSRGPAKKAGELWAWKFKCIYLTEDVDVTMNLSDGEWKTDSSLNRPVYCQCRLTFRLADTFVALADGKLNGQKAFMTGALKVKGNVSCPYYNLGEADEWCQVMLAVHIPFPSSSYQ
jgi:hypothetical protein